MNIILIFLNFYRLTHVIAMPFYSASLIETVQVIYKYIQHFKRSCYSFYEIDYVEN